MQCWCFFFLLDIWKAKCAKRGIVAFEKWGTWWSLLTVLNCSTKFVAGFISNRIEYFLNISSLIQNDLIHHIRFFFILQFCFCPLRKVLFKVDVSIPHKCATIILSVFAWFLPKIHVSTVIQIVDDSLCVLQVRLCLLRVQQKLTDIFSYFLLWFCSTDSYLFSRKFPFLNTQSYPGCASAARRVYENLCSLLQALRILVLEFFLSSTKGL